MQSRPWVTSLMVLATLGATACGDSTGPSPSLTLTVASAAVTLTQGATQVVNVTIARENFDKPVTLAVEGTLPAGITAVLTQTSLASSQTTTFLTISATGNATPANVTLAIVASGEGIASQTQPLTVSVTLRGNYTLGTAGPAAVMATDGAASAIVTLARTGGNTSDVALVASGVPAGVTAAFAQSPVSGNGVTLRFTASGSPAPGSYPVTVTGSAVGFPANQTTTVQLQVIAAPARTSTSIPVCTNSAPLWFAYQNSGYGWQRVTPSGTEFTFEATEKVSVAFVRSTASVTETIVYSLMRSELAFFSARHCSTARTHTVSVGDVSATQSALVTMDTGSVLLSSTTPSFSFSNLPSRPIDLFAVRGSVNQGRLTPDRVIIRRAIDATAPAAIPVLDFAAGESFAPATSTLTFTNALAGGFVVAASTFRTPAFADGVLQVATPGASSFTLYAVPVDRLAAGDVQETYLYAETSSALSGHGVVDYTRAPVDRSVSFGPQLQAPVVSLLSSAPYAIFRAALGTQSEYATVVRMTYCQGTGSCTKLLRHVITPGHLGGVPSTWESVIPDFTGAAGFDPAWMMSGGTFTPYLAEAFSGRTGLVFGDMPVDGDLYRFAFLESSLSSGALRASLRQSGAAPPRLGPQYLRR